MLNGRRTSLRRAGPLLAGESRNNLVLGIAGAARRHPVYCQGAARPEAVERLAGEMDRQGVRLPGSPANRPTVDWLLESWADRPTRFKAGSASQES
jgi:hypothetical protein